MLKFKWLLLFLSGLLTDCPAMPLWEKYWKDDLRQFSTAQIDKYFADIVELASPNGPIPPARVKAPRKTYKLKNVKVLFILPYQEVRYPFELASRFDISYDMLPVSLFSRQARQKTGFKKVPRDFTEKLLDDIEAQKFDVIVTRNFNADALTVPELERVKNWIRNGLGWVDLGVMGAEKENTLRQLLPLSSGRWIRRKPAKIVREHFISSGSNGLTTGIKVKQKINGTVLLQVDKDPAAAICEQGKGRIVSHPVQWLHTEENYGLLMKCILWSARKEPPFYLRAKADEKGLHLQLSDKTFQSKADIFWTACHENGLSQTSGKCDLISGKASLFPVQKLPAGKITLHYSLVGAANQLLDWGACTLTLPDEGMEATLSLPEMYDRKKNFINGQTTFINKSPTTADIRYTLELFDGSGRKLPAALKKSLTLPPGGKKSIPFKMDCDWRFLPGPVGYLHLKIHRGEKLSHLIRQAVFAPKDPALAAQDWQCGIWGTEVECNVGKTTPDDGLTKIFAPVLRTYGVNAVGDGIWRYPDDLFAAAREGFYIHTEYLAPLFGTWHKTYPDHIFMPKKNYTPPWFEKGKKILAQQTARVSRLRKLGVVSYACDEEIGLGPSESCFSEETRKLFLRWCLKKYGSFEKISRSWGISCTSEKDIRGILLADALKRDPANPAQWMDFRFFMEECFNGAVEEYVRLGKKTAPEAFFGYGAGPHTDIPNQGHNRSRLGRTITGSVEYLGPFFRQGSVPRNFDILRSRNVPMLISIAGYPYHMVHSKEQYPSCAWYTALHGGRGIMYYAAIHPSLWGKLHPTGAPNGATLRMQEANKDLLNGIGKVILNARRQAQIGIYYSRNTQYAWAWRQALNRTATGKNTPPDMKKQMESLRDDPGGGMMTDKNSADHALYLSRHGMAALRELAAGSGYGYDMVFPDQLLAGKLEKKYNILMLPGIITLSAQEFTALRKFVRQGGILICDMLTGIYDDLGRKNPLLPEIEKFFGFRRTGGLFLKTVKSLPQKAGFALEGFAGEKITPAAGTRVLAQNEFPFALYRTEGKGQILYLNTVPKQGGKWNQWAWDPMKISPGLRSFLQQMAQKAGMRPPRTGQLADTDIVRFKNASGEYLFLSRGYQKISQPVQLVLGKEKYIHDMRSRRFLGKKSHLALPALPPAYTAAYALTDHKIREIKIQMQDTIRPGCQIAFEIDPVIEGEKPSEVIFNCTVFDPDNRKDFRFSANFLWKSDRKKYTIFPTLNEKKGRWKIVISHVCGDAQAEKNFTF